MSQDVVDGEIHALGLDGNLTTQERLDKVRALLRHPSINAFKRERLKRWIKSVERELRRKGRAGELKKGYHH